MTDPTPKPCPFCGSDRVKVVSQYDKYVFNPHRDWDEKEMIDIRHLRFVKCHACFSQGPALLVKNDIVTDNEVILLWNQIPNGGSK